MSSNIKAQTIRGVIWSSIERFSMQGVQFVLSIIMARLLTPDDYGLIGMILVFMSISQVFIDGGFDAARYVIVNMWRDLAAMDVVAPKDPKTALQELVQQADNGNLPVYEYGESVGASHSPVFHVRVSAMGKSADGVGPSKKAASVAAAEALLKVLAI